jgi:hypothetical protein
MNGSNNTVLSKLPDDIKEACDAYSDKLRTQTRLWATSLGIAVLIIVKATNLNGTIEKNPNKISLPFKLGDADPATFFALTCWILSGLWFGQLVQYSQSVRAHQLLNSRLNRHNNDKLGQDMGLSEYVDIFHASGPGHVSPLLSVWKLDYPCLRVPLKLIVSTTTHSIPIVALFLGMRAFFNSNGAPLWLCIVVPIPAVIVTVVTLGNLFVREWCQFLFPQK